MRIKILQGNTEAVLFEVEAETTKQAVEIAVRRGVCLNGADLRGADLTRAYLIGARLRQAYLSDARLGHALLRGALLDGAELRNADLTQTCLDNASLIRADLDGSRLERATLYGARLNIARLIGASLNYSRLDDANLDGANLDNTSLLHTRLDGAHLKNARLPSPTTVLLANWRRLSDQLTADLMLYDASNHPDPSRFDAWAKGGDCPYSRNYAAVQRAANFIEIATLWGRGVACRPYDLMTRVLAERCPEWSEGRLREFDEHFQNQS